jgi:general secretion pathway protein I
MVVEGRTVVLSKKKPAIDDFKPQVMIFANGDLTSFEVSLKREGGRDQARLYSDEQTNIRLLLPGEVEPQAAACERTASVNRLQKSHGFTLLEVLIALAIVAMSVGALLGTVTSSASNVIYLKDKTLAEWVALNRLTELRIDQNMPDKGKRSGNSTMGGSRWVWEEEVIELPIEGLFRIDVRPMPPASLSTIRSRRISLRRRSSRPARQVAPRSTTLHGLRRSPESSAARVRTCARLLRRSRRRAA